MIYKSKLSSIFLIFSCTIFLASCTNLQQEIMNKAQDRQRIIIDDYFRGYRIEYHSIPAGARIVCNEEEQGVAPFFKYRDLTPEQKNEELLVIKNCEAIWYTGARAEIQVTIPLDLFPKFVNLVAERPRDAPDYEIDDSYGYQALASKQKQQDDAIVAVTHLGDLLGGVILQKITANKNKGSAANSQAYNAPSQSVSGANGIRWNWVQPSTTAMPIVQSNFSLLNSNSRQVLTPVYSASSCLGSIVMGKCYGTIADAGIQSYCAGTFVNGTCNGSVLFGK
jgi:hypothetical protein